MPVKSQSEKCMDYFSDSSGLLHIVANSLCELNLSAQCCIRKLNDDDLATSLVVQSFELDYNRPFTFWYHKPSKVSGYATLSRALTIEEAKISGISEVALSYYHCIDYVINALHMCMSLNSRWSATHFPSSDDSTPGNKVVCFRGAV